MLDNVGPCRLLLWCGCDESKQRPAVHVLIFLRDGALVIRPVCTETRLYVVQVPRLGLVLQDEPCSVIAYFERSDKRENWE